MILDWFKNNKRKKLERHHFFTTISYWINIEIDNLPIKNECKKKVICLFLKIKYNIFSKNIKKIIASESTNCQDLEDIIIASFNECEVKARSEGIPDIFINKFRIWDHDHTKILIDSVDSIIRSNFYSTFEEKVAAILDLMIFSFRLTLVDAEKTINELNGELEKALEGTIFSM